MAINLRSPHYVGENILVDGYNVYKIFIYETTQPATPTYTIRKGYNANYNAGNIEISELIRDYLDTSFGQDYESQCIKVVVEFQIYDSSGSVDADGDYGLDFAFDSYSYFEETNFSVDNSPLMISNREIFGLADNFVRIPINTKHDPTITFFNKGVIVGTQSFTGDEVVANQIKYITLVGESDSDSFIDRIALEGDTYEPNECIVAFLDEYEIGEVDEIRVSDDNSGLETVKVKVLEECKYEPKKVTFINKFGALQDMYFFKKSVEMMNVEKESYKSNILDSNAEYSRSSHVNRNFNVVGKESVTLSSGFLNEEYNEVFKQMMLSEKVWVTTIVDGVRQVLPINVKTSDITYKTSLNDKLVEYTIEFDKSYNTINNIR